MQISKINNNIQTNFKGLEAQKLQAIYVQGNELLGGEETFKQLEAIAKQHKIGVLKTNYGAPWIQDNITFTPDGRVLTKNMEMGRNLANRHGFRYDRIMSEDKRKVHHVAGGNLFFATNNKGKKVAITAQDYFGENELKGYQNFYNVDKIIELPRADFHADLFITPIGDNKILVADDKMTLNSMLRMIEKIEDYINSNPNSQDCEKLILIAKRIYNKMMQFHESKIKYTANGALDETANILKDEGFEVIRVPSVVYQSYAPYEDKNLRLMYDMNFSNALTYKNDENEVVYITGKSNLDDIFGISKDIQEKVGIGFEKMFIDTLKPYIKPQNIHFILGDSNNPIYEILRNHKGGLHCMCAEVPLLED
ncbi:hypothetical protein IJX73_03575 [bacterium]|nr:hypothetical protein [bacterium]